MNKIEEEMYAAVMARKKSWKKGNTSVSTKGKQSYVYLHGFLIAIYDHVRKTWKYSDANVSYDGEVCGSTTTKSRLNALGANINRKGGLWYRNGEPFKNDFVIGRGGTIYRSRYGWRLVEG